jgi:hypothetical protein
MLLQTLLAQATDPKQADHYRQRIAALQTASLKPSGPPVPTAEDTP